MVMEMELVKKNRSELATQKREYIRSWLRKNPGRTVKQAGDEVHAHFGETLGQNDLVNIVKSVQEEHRQTARRAYGNGDSDAGPDISPKPTTGTQAALGSLPSIVEQMKVAGIRMIEIREDGALTVKAD